MLKKDFNTVKRLFIKRVDKGIDNFGNWKVAKDMLHTLKGLIRSYFDEVEKEIFDKEE